MKIILVGYRGAGKSTVAKMINPNKNLTIFSMDTMIEEKAGQSINEMVAQKGWDFFRDLETAVLKEVLKFENAIIDCGGGVIEKTENRELLKQEKNVFFLETSIPIIIERLADKTDRPSLSGEHSFLEEVKSIYTRRLPLYREVSTHTINADESPEEVAEQIIRFL